MGAFSLIVVINLLNRCIMALDLDDKLLGEQVNNYISSSEDEGEEDVKGDDEHPEYRYGEMSARNQAPTEEDLEPEQPVIDYSRTSSTGPKGVIEDYRRFKQLEAEKREEQKRELMALSKRIAMTCAPQTDEELDPDMQELNAIFEEYKLQRMNEMESILQSVPTFGKVNDLAANEFVTAIDNEHQLVTVIVLVHDPVNAKHCDMMYHSIKILANVYKKVKFCAISAIEAGLSDKFRSEATPALLVYKNKEQIGTFVQLVQELGDEIFAVDVEKFLIEHSLLPSNESKLSNMANEDD